MNSKISVLFSLACLTSACSVNNPAVPPVNKFDNKPKDAIHEENPPKSEKKEIFDWFLKNPENDKVEGVSADRAYTELALKKGKTVIVAVIDGGVDVNHEDLREKIWTNPGEIPANGIDDEKNGYIDDVHGWNFIGSYDKDGKPRNIDSEQLESTREVVRLKKKKAAQGGSLSTEEQAYLDKLTVGLEKARAEAKEEFDTDSKILADFRIQYDLIAGVLDGKFEELTLAKVEGLKSDDSVVVGARQKLVTLFNENGIKDLSRLIRRRDNAKSTLEKYLNEDFSPRKEIIGDDPENYADRNYGNNDVAGPDASHGTHVAGIIAAVRGNGIGIAGVANDAMIMAIRVVPDGDERDKDIANGIRYAVDNGAHVINMSFGKKYSPGKAAVDEAMLYAESKNVLIVHAAGNDSADNDKSDHFPSRTTLKGSHKISTWLDIGASASLKGEQLPAAFSNYAQKDVDFFAPGAKILSTVPGNRYEAFSGTSMAAPVAAGVAALVWSQKPDLSAAILRIKMRESVRKYDGLVVRLPGSDPIQGVLFSRLSQTGGITDALATLKNVLAPVQKQVDVR